MLNLVVRKETARLLTVKPLLFGSSQKCNFTKINLGLETK